MIRKVILESPYAGGINRNVLYARMALKDSLKRGEAPIASHLLYPQVLDDDIPEERKLGIDSGHAWLEVAEAMVVYEDLGLSSGMKLGIVRAIKAGLKIEYRKIITGENHIL